MNPTVLAWAPTLTQGIRHGHQTHPHQGRFRPALTLVVAIAGNPSGTAATARATAVVSM